MTFKEKYQAGEIEFEAIDDYVDEWNNSDDERTLAKFLGLNADDKLLVYRARKLQRFFSQPFAVASVYTGIPGKYVPLSTTIDDCNAILDGKCDDIPESEFYFIGGLADIAGYQA